METTKKSYAFVTPLLIAASVLLAGLFNEISRPKSGSSRNSPVNSSKKNVAESAPFRGPSIRFRGVDLSEDTDSYLDEKYPRSPNDDESDEDLAFAKETLELCRDAFSKKEVELVENGVVNVAYRMTGGKFIFAANAGMKGNYEFSFDVERDPATIAEEFGFGLDRLIKQLIALDDEPGDAGPGDLGSMLETSRERRKEPFFPSSILVLSIFIAIFSLSAAVSAIYKSRSTVEEDESTSGETNNDGT